MLDSDSEEERESRVLARVDVTPGSTTLQPQWAEAYGAQMLAEKIHARLLGSMAPALSHEAEESLFAAIAAKKLDIGALPAEPEAARVALLNCGPTGSETLKNLVLGGIASFTVVDGGRVEPRDLGNNFMVEASALGQPRAKVVTGLLKEMNESVRGSYVEEAPEALVAVELRAPGAVQLPQRRQLRAAQEAEQLVHHRLGQAHEVAHVSGRRNLVHF